MIYPHYPHSFQHLEEENYVDVFIYIKNSLTIQENLDFTSFRQDSWRRKNKNPLSYPHYPQYPRQIWWIMGLFSFFRPCVMMVGTVRDGPVGQRMAERMK